MLTLEEGSALLLTHRMQSAAGPTGTARVPRRVMQYWDREPPEQIQRLIGRTRELCQRAGAEHVLFDHPQARAYMQAHGGEEGIAAYDIAEHPAMKCDVFRLCYLQHSGGYYVDADIVLRPNLAELFAIPGDLVVFQWDSQNISNLCNWLIGAAAGDPSMAAAHMATARNVLRACRKDPEAALKNILGVSGPGIFTRAVATDLQRRLATPGERAEAVNVQTVSRAHQLIQLGPAFLKSPLAYKSDERHWRTAGQADTGAPASTPAPAAEGGWLARLASRLGGRK